MSALLIIFAKEPVPGQVKTRLSPPLSLEGAARLYQTFLIDILEEMARLSEIRLAVAYMPESGREFFQNLAPPGVRLFPQAGQDLGERMALALAWGFQAGHCPVLLRGSDTPDLPGSIILEAGEALGAGHADLVLGPAADGGYYMVGLNSPQPELFQDLIWSTSQVMAETLDRARSLALPVHLLPAWPDIDTGDDLAAFLSRSHPEPGPGWRSHRLARELLASPGLDLEQG